MSFRAACLADGPLQGYSFYETGASVTDETGHGYTGTLWGEYTTQQPARSGDAGDYAVSLDEGTTDGAFYAELHPDIIAGVTDDVTVELLIKIPVGAGGCRLFHLQPRNSLWMSETNQVSGGGARAIEGSYFEAWVMKSTRTLCTVQIPSTTVELCDGNWHHVAVTFSKYFSGQNSTRIFVWIDGVQYGPTAFGVGAPIFDEGVAGNPFPSRFYVGASTSLVSANPEGAANGASVCEAWLYDIEFTQAIVDSHIAELPDIVPVNLGAPIELYQATGVALWARLAVLVQEAVSLSAPIELNTGAVALSAPLALLATAEVSLSAALNLAVRDAVDVDRASARWSLRLLIGGVDQSARLTGTADVEHVVNASGLASFELLPSSGVIDQAALIGAEVLLYFQDRDASGALQYEQLEYRGLVSDPRFDAASGVLRVQCTSDLQGVADRATRAQIDALLPGSTWSPQVFDEGAQGFEYLQDRLRTLTADLYHSPGGIKVVAWQAAATAHKEFTDATLLGIGPYVPANRRELINQVAITFDYRYQRKRQRTLYVNWVTTQTWCEFLIHGWTLCQRSQVEAAANDGAWVRQGEIAFTALPAAGCYRCFPQASGPASNKFICWGREYLGYLLPDPDWDNLCMGAKWKTARRWAQTVTERYRITVQAPQSQAGNGRVALAESYSLTSDQDLTSWLDDKTFSTSNAVTAGGYVGVGGNATLGSFTLGDIAKDATDDEATGRAAAQLARTTMLAAARADVLRAHRRNRVTALVSYQPDVDLRSTVRVNGRQLIAKGRVVRKRSTFAIDNGEALTELELAVSRHEGTGLVVDDPVTPDSPPDKPSEAEAAIPTILYAGTYVGGRTTTPPLTGAENGYFSNYVWDPTDTDPFAADPSNPTAIRYPEEFAITYPEISGSALDSLELPAAQTLNVEIPVDELTLIQ